MTESEVRQLMVAFARLESKVDERFASMKESIDDLKGWKDRMLMLVVTLVITGVVATLFGTGAVRLP
jgi:hypothetical protein